MSENKRDTLIPVITIQDFSNEIPKLEIKKEEKEKELDLIKDEVEENRIDAKNEDSIKSEVDLASNNRNTLILEDSNINIADVIIKLPDHDEEKDGDSIDSDNDGKNKSSKLEVPGGDSSVSQSADEQSLLESSIGDALSNFEEIYIDEDSTSHILDTLISNSDKPESDKSNNLPDFLINAVKNQSDLTIGTNQNLGVIKLTFKYDEIKSHFMITVHEAKLILI